MPNIDALQGNDDSHMGPPSYYQRHYVSGGARAQLRHSLLTLTDPGLTPPTTLLSPTPKPSNLSQHKPQASTYLTNTSGNIIKIEKYFQRETPVRLRKRKANYTFSYWHLLSNFLQIS